MASAQRGGRRSHDESVCVYVWDVGVMVTITMLVINYDYILRFGDDDEC
jgi:hypothetical protein